MFVGEPLCWAKPDGLFLSALTIKEKTKLQMMPLTQQLQLGMKTKKRLSKRKFRQESLFLLVKLQVYRLTT